MLTNSHIGGEQANSYRQGEYPNEHVHRGIVLRPIPLSARPIPQPPAFGNQRIVQSLAGNPNWPQRSFRQFFTNLPQQSESKSIKKILEIFLAFNGPIINGFRQSFQQVPLPPSPAYGPRSVPIAHLETFLPSHPSIIFINTQRTLN